ncbi:tyrosine-type recombinase/integrase [Rhodobacter sp. KR11]|uniref:tyrosine-type recombinase/integrase n=1 Tax=Rhodobacter sp. KR11 TaxID=2974588 RepID=UPI002221B9A3|nr:tyrosine-type recombinase/integrase [Rhodobacter sp. KR11]MCW1920849.1 tyrosine-type recombinase/integrase [Rhodobacter sp. KR11]
MKKVDLPHLRHKRAKGKDYWYFERMGERIALPPPDAPDFLEQYQIAKRGHRPAPLQGRTFKRLIAEYRASPRWTRLAPRTRKDYEKVLDWAEATFGDLSPAKMERRHVIRAQAENAERLRFANYIVQVLSVLFEQAIDLGWITHNPAKGIRLLKSEGEDLHKPWPVDTVEAYTAAAAFGTPARTILELAIGTGQRIGDLLKMRWDAIEGDGIAVRQGKTKTALWIPFTPRLKAYLDALPRRALTIVAGADGRPMQYFAAAKAVMVVRKAVGAEAYTIHGWRYTAAAELAAAGASDEEVQAITGHKSRAMVVKYAGAQRQRTHAAAAQAKREPKA